jgi:cellulose synthase/poly-beta-1,6-N-acetylglucosamine synthase-like glycosyltransferase
VKSLLKVSKTATAAIGLGLAASYGHLGYPAILGLRASRRKPRPMLASPKDWPAITIVVPAYRESTVLQDKIDNLLANGYEGEVEVLVVAEDERTADIARQAGVRVIQPEMRLGKSRSMNLGMELATHDFIVFTDANNVLLPGAIANVVIPLVHGAGGAAGEKIHEEEGGESIYWKFESWLKQKEDILGSTVGICGELFAVRREAWKPIPDDISSDDLWIAIDFIERGHRLAYVAEAKALEPPFEPGKPQWERRTRILAGALFVAYDKKHLLLRRNSLVTFEIWGHSLWRSTAGPLAHVGLVGLAASKANKSRLAQAFLCTQALSAVAGRLVHNGRELPTPVAAVGQVMYLQAVALAGMRRALRGDRITIWPKQNR